MKSWVVVTSAVLVALVGVACADFAGKAGTWPDADKFDCNWLPSRSTHYGFTARAACGQGAAPNCAQGQADPVDISCKDVPADLKNNPYAGLYAAPQGDYYVQTGDYVSCGECFEVRCDDAHCVKDASLVLQLVDSCPCDNNRKWCCNIDSACDEMSQLPALEGQGHCPVPAVGGAWDTAHSIHLDLDDAAFSLLSTGSRTGQPAAGVINTFFRRVPCTPQGNLYLSFDSKPQVNATCYVGNGVPKIACAYYLQFSVLNAAGWGSVTHVYFGGTMFVNNKNVTGEFLMPLIASYGDLQQRFAAFASPQQSFGAMLFPFYFRLANRQNQSVLTQNFTYDTMRSCVGPWCYFDTGVQFSFNFSAASCGPKPVDPCAGVNCGAHGTCSNGACTCKDGFSGATCTTPPPVSSSSGSPKPPPPSSTGSIGPVCSRFFTLELAAGASPYYLEFNLNTKQTISAPVTVSAGGVAATLIGPMNWPPRAMVYQLTPMDHGTPLASPIIVNVKATDGSQGFATITSFSTVTYC